MSLDQNLDKILIIDFGSQFTQLIARRIRELGVFSEIISHKKIRLKDVDQTIKGIILSGGPLNVYQINKYSFDKKILDLNIPVLGICFGHQLLCHSLGSEIERAESLSSGIWTLELTTEGEKDFLLTSHVENNEKISGLFSHQDHVMSVPNNCTLLSKTSHNMVTAVRVNNELGEPMPAWGIQFHPEAARKRIERAYGWGHISEEEYKSFKGEHDGAGILSSFAKDTVKGLC